MKKNLKITAFIVLILVSTLSGALYFISKPLPVGQQGAKAEELTDKIQAAINQKSWDPTSAVSFTFRRNHHYLFYRCRR